MILIRKSSCVLDPDLFIQILLRAFWIRIMDLEPNIPVWFSKYVSIRIVNTVWINNKGNPLNPESRFESETLISHPIFWVFDEKNTQIISWFFIWKRCGLVVWFTFPKSSGRDSNLGHSKETRKAQVFSFFSDAKDTIFCTLPFFFPSHLPKLVPYCFW